LKEPDRLVVHVDAKIINRDSVDKEKVTLVGYCMEDGSGGESRKIKKEDSDETDAAEFYAVEFAMEHLVGRPEGFRLVCDNESVVSTLHEDDLGSRIRRPITKKVWNMLHESDKFEVVQFPANQAHRLLNEAWKDMKAST